MAKEKKPETIERTEITQPEKADAPISKEAHELNLLRERFGPYRPATEETGPKFKQIQEKFLEVAELVFDLCPSSQQRSSAFTLLEQAKMSANAAIAIHTPRTVAQKGVQA